jgi:hypothetical protein
VAVRAIDDCKNVGPITTVSVITPARPIGAVDACFVHFLKHRFNTLTFGYRFRRAVFSEYVQKFRRPFRRPFRRNVGRPCVDRDPVTSHNPYSP